MTTQESYAKAVCAKSLKISTLGVTSVDYLIAAGWCRYKLGGCLMRLRAEWDGSERWGVKVPVYPTRRAIESEAAFEVSKGVKKITKESYKAATLKLINRYESEVKSIARSLKSLPAVMELMKPKYEAIGLKEHEARTVLLHWLDPTCKHCKGTALQLCGEKQCAKCEEHPGFNEIPCGELGKELFMLFDEYTQKAENSLNSYCKNH